MALPAESSNSDAIETYNNFTSENELSVLPSANMPPNQAERKAITPFKGLASSIYVNNVLIVDQDSSFSSSCSFSSSSTTRFCSLLNSCSNSGIFLIDA